MTLELASSRDAATTSRADSPLAVRGMTVSYGQKPAVFSVDMTVQPGKMTAIIGPNGAGKSTLLKAALGILTPLAGTATVYGKPVAEQRHRIAYVPQRASVDWDFPTRVIDVVLMGLYPQLGLLGRIRPVHRARATDCLARVGMEDFATRQIGQLSGGQQQRVFLARALAQDADLYLLDEPFAGVDPISVGAIRQLVAVLKKRGIGVLITDHNVRETLEIVDRAYILHEGKVLMSGTPEEVVQNENVRRVYLGDNFRIS